MKNMNWIYFMCVAIALFLIMSCEQTEEYSEVPLRRETNISNLDSVLSEILLKTNLDMDTMQDSCISCIFDTAYSLTISERWEEAIIYDSKYLELDTTNWKVYANRASCFYSLWFYKLALQDYLHAHKINPIFDNQISHMYFATNNRELACRYYQHAMEKGDTTFNAEINSYCISLTDLP